MTSELKQRTFHAVLWSSLERGGRQGVMLLIQLVLARLLTPEQFGLIVVPITITTLAQVLVDGGFGSALVQKKDLTEADKCSVFYFNILVGLILTTGLILAAPWIAAFYGRPLLTPLVQWASLTVLFRSFGVVHLQLLTKQMDFKSQVKATIASVLMGGTTGITLALLGFGVWALVAQTLVIALVNTIGLWVVDSWRPTWLFQWSALRSMLGFGSRVFATSLMTCLFANIYMLLFGKLFEVGKTLGYYTQARRLQLAPTSIIGHIVQRVSFPLFASIQDDLVKIRHIMRRSISLLCLTNLPMVLFLAASGQVLVTVLIGEKWIPIVPYLRVLVFWGVLQPIQIIHTNKYLALGHAGLAFKIDVVRKIMTIANILITYRYNIMAMLIGQAISDLLGFMICMWQTRRLAHYGMGEQLADIAKPLMVAVAMGAAVWGAGFLPLNVFVLLGIQMILASAIWLSLCFLLRIPAFLDLVSMGRNALAKLRAKRQQNHLTN
jgi:teichuronic acid exporter